MKRIPLLSKDLQLIKEILENDAKCPVDIVEGLNNISFRSDANELYLKNFPIPVHTLIISRIQVNITRTGVGTKILNELISYSKEKGFSVIVVESCMTNEMREFCKKHGFTPDPSTAIELKDGLLANWILKLK